MARVHLGRVTAFMVVVSAAGGANYYPFLVTAANAYVVHDYVWDEGTERCIVLFYDGVALFGRLALGASRYFRVVPIFWLR